MEKQKETTKAVATKQMHNLPMEVTGKWGDDQVDKEDIRIPTIMVMQPTSDFVTEGLFKPGDLVKSGSKELMASPGKPIEIIPLLMFKNWNVEKKVGTKFKYHSTEEITALNAESPQEWEDNGEVYRRNRTLNFYVLFPTEIVKEQQAIYNANEKGILPDPSDALLPCLIRCKRSNYGVGKDLATHFQKANHFGVPAAISTFNLSTRIEKGDDGTYAVYELSKAGKTLPEHLEIAYKWYQTIKNVPVTVIDSDKE